MNQNYLLHNETAKKLYFQYAKDLPIIAFCNQSDDVYTNITEAFLSNDTYKLESMRQGGIDEKYITGNASDYEKFKAFCKVLPKFAGNPIYLLSHIELLHNFNCELDICEDNCDMIWSMCNEYLINNTINNKFNTVQCFDLDDITEVFNINSEFNTFEDYINSVIVQIYNANDLGCKNAIITLCGGLERPNPYTVNEIYSKLQENYDNITYKEFRILDVQILREIGKVCKKLSWNYLYRLYEPSEELLNYLDENNALPTGNIFYQYDFSEKANDFAIELSNYAKDVCLGNAICTFEVTSIPSIYARSDYFRRIVCNAIGEWVENGEYTPDEKLLKELIEDILHNNLKEAIL